MMNKVHLAGIKEGLDAQIKALEAQGVYKPHTRTYPPKGEIHLTPDQKAAMERENMRFLLQDRMTLLVNLRHKLDEDPEVFNFVDRLITNQVQASEKRQRTSSAAVTIFVALGALIARWLLSALSPAAVVLHMLGY
jgi:hypothetical protein